MLPYLSAWDLSGRYELVESGKSQTHDAIPVHEKVGGACVSVRQPNKVFVDLQSLQQRCSRLWENRGGIPATLAGGWDDAVLSKPLSSHCSSN